MIQVSVNEARLLMLARFGLGLAEDHQVMPSLLTRQPTVAKLGPTAINALQDSLARGTVHALAQGGWRPFGKQRLWEREKAPQLLFTPAVFQVLNWLLFVPLSAEQVQALPALALTPAEDFFFAQFILRQKDPRVRRNLLRQPAFQNAPLTRLMHGGFMALATGEPIAAAPIDLAAYAVFLEASSELLTGTWLQVERLKRTCRMPHQLTAIGQTQLASLQALLTSADAAGRRELVTFALATAREFLADDPTIDALVGPLDPATSLRDRTTARQAAGALMQSLGTIHTWDEAHRTVHFVDDGYAKAQLLLKHWEPYREFTFARAARMVEALRQLPT